MNKTTSHSDCNFLPTKPWGWTWTLMQHFLYFLSVKFKEYKSVDVTPFPKTIQWLCTKFRIISVIYLPQQEPNIHSKLSLFIEPEAHPHMPVIFFFYQQSKSVSGPWTFESLSISGFLKLSPLSKMVLVQFLCVSHFIIQSPDQWHLLK